jgi:hypothetical protein
MLNAAFDLLETFYGSSFGRLEDPCEQLLNHFPFSHYRCETPLCCEKEHKSGEE